MGVAYPTGLHNHWFTVIKIYRFQNNVTDASAETRALEQTSASFLAELSVSSPREFFIFII